MFTKRLVAVLGAASLMLGAAACGSDSNDENAADEVEESVDKAVEETTEAAEEEANADDGSSSEDDPSISDLTEGMPEDFEGCVSVGLTYASVYLALLGDDQAMDDAIADLEELQGQVPDEIADDLDVIATGLSEAGNIVDAGEFMESDEYIEADANVSEFLDEACGS